MFPVLEVLVAVIIAKASMATAGLDGEPHWWGVLALQLVGLAASLAAARWTARRLARGQVAAAVRAHERSFFAVRLAVLGLYAIQVRLLGWPGIVDALGLRGWILVDEILVLAPFFLFLIGVWSASYGVERSFRFHRWTRLGYVMFQLRQRLLPIVPMLFLFTLYDTLEVLAGRIRIVGRFRLWMQEAVPAQWAVVISSFVLIMILAPFLFRWLWGMRPMPDGPLRRRLEEFGRRVGFRTRDILLWPTRNNVLNAAIIGLTGRFRYVMITDGLIRSLSEDEIEAVYAHEVGHAKHRHMLLFLLFAISFMFILHILTLYLPAVFILRSDEAQIALLIAMVVLWWGVLFGWISRRLETQADVYGATATARAHDAGNGSAFISALENLAEESGQIRHLRGLRHPSVAERTDFLHRYLSDGSVRKRYRRSVRWLIAVLGILFLLVAGIAVSTMPAQWRVARVRVAWADGNYLEAFERCGALDPGPSRTALLHATTMRLVRTIPSERAALEAAESLVRFSREDPDDPYVKLDIGYLLVLAAQGVRGPDAASRTWRHIEDAAPILERVVESGDDSPNGRNLSAEAAMLLGTAFNILADGLVHGSPFDRLADGPGVDSPLASGSSRVDEWKKTIWLARTRLEQAESLEPAPREGESPDSDHLRLRGDLEACEGRLDDALAAYRAAGRAGARSSMSWKLRAVVRRQRAPLGRRDLSALADWLARVSEPGIERVEMRLVVAGILTTEARLALGTSSRRREVGVPLVPEDHVVLLDMAAPMLRRLADPESGDEPVPERIRAGALEELARLYTALAESALPDGRDLTGWDLWRRHLLELAVEANRRASALR